MRRRENAEDLASNLASLATLGTNQLKERWRVLYGGDPPAHISRHLLVRAVAYRLQENALGGLRPQTRRLLARLGKKARDPTVMPAPVKLTPGTRLVRQWQGRTHQVVILEDGVLFRGERRGSLSEVARLITGSRWSGPLFFGLKRGSDDHDQP